MDYVAVISASLHGSMTPHEILWDISLARGRQLEIAWWMAKGIPCVTRKQ